MHCVLGVLGVLSSLYQPPQNPHKLGITAVPLLEETDEAEETSGPDINWMRRMMMVMIWMVREGAGRKAQVLDYGEGIPQDWFNVRKEGNGSAHISDLVVVKLRNFWMTSSCIYMVRIYCVLLRLY